MEEVERRRSRSRVALALSGSVQDPTIYSGLPSSLQAALVDLGIDVVPIDVQLRGPWQRVLVNLVTVAVLDPRLSARAWHEQRSVRLAFRANKARLESSRAMTAIRSAVAASKLRACRDVDRGISWGTEFRLPLGTDYVTLDDSTIVQQRIAFDYPWMKAVSERSLAGMIARQHQIFHRARACCLLTHWAAASAVSDYRIPPEQVHVVGLGPNRVLSPRDRDWSTPRFLFVGTDFERKNGPGVLRAFAEVRAQHPHAMLDVVGEHARIDDEGVVAHGPLPLSEPAATARANALFERATCFVMPSHYEPAGIVFAEALSAGIGSIGPANGGAATIIGDAGVTVPADHPGVIARQMLRFCDPVEAQAFAVRARLRAPLFTWNATAQRVVRALHLPAYADSELAPPL